MKNRFTKIMITTAVMGIAVSTLFVTGCSQTPMEKLQSDKPQVDMQNFDYWEKEAKAKSALWKEASSYCLKHIEKVNCTAVVTEVRILNSATTAPPMGHSGETIKFPNFK